MAISQGDFQVVAEMTRRHNDGLEMLRVLDTQLPIFTSDASELLVRGGNRSGKSLSCAAKFAAVARDKPIYGPDGTPYEQRLPHQKDRALLMWCHDDQTEVLTDSGWKFFSRLNGSEKLATVNLHTDTLEFQTPSRVYSKKHDGDMIRFSGDKKLDALVTPEHRMVVYPDAQSAGKEGAEKPVIKLASDLCQKDRLKSTVANWVGAEPELPSFLDGISAVDFAEWLGFYVAEGCCNHAENGNGYCHWKVMITQKKPDGVKYAKELMDRMPFRWHHTHSGNFVICSKDLWQHLEPLGNVYSKHVPQWVKDSTPEIITAFLNGYFAGDGHERECGYLSASSVSRQLMDDIQELLLKTGRSGAIKVRPPGEYQFKSEGRSGQRRESYVIQVWNRDKLGLRRRIKNKTRAQRENLFQRESGYDGYVYCATVPNGTLITRRNGKPLISGNCIGLKWDHIGDTIWRLLFKPGLYKIVRDELTGRWRAFNPKLDSERPVTDIKPSFPLIPLSEVDGGIEGIEWENKKGRQFSTIPMKNGTIIKAYASTGEVKQGDPVDYIWIDEEIAIVGHYPEWQARLSDTKGRIVWSSLSQMNPALLSFTKRATEQQREVKDGTREKPDVEEYVLKFSANPHIDEEEKRKRQEGWDEDERKMRDEGEYTIGNIKVYPTFNRLVHRAVYENPDEDDKLSKILRERNGVPPDDWTRELILDPGTAKPGVLFGAIPTEDYFVNGEPYYVVYDEIFGLRIDADEIAKRVKAKSSGYTFQRFIIDGMAARQTPMGFAGTIGQNYSRAFQEQNLHCVETGTAFSPGDPNWQNRSLIVENWLVVRSCGRPLLRVVIDNCPYLVDQLESNLKAIQKGPSGEVIVLDKPAPGQKDDLRNCLEYWASRRPTWVQPPVKGQQELGGNGLKVFNAIQKRFQKADADDGVVKFGPGPKRGVA